MLPLLSKPTAPQECANCGKQEGDEGTHLKVCGGCKHVLWCSKECQRSGWPAHRFNCRINTGARLQAAKEKQEVSKNGTDKPEGTPLPRHLNPTALIRDINRWKDVRLATSALVLQ